MIKVILEVLAGIVCSVATYLGFADEHRARFVVWSSARHLSCRRKHSGMTHEDWLERIHEPVSARFLARRGYKP